MATVASTWRQGARRLLVLRVFGFASLVTRTGWPRWSLVVGWIIVVHFAPAVILCLWAEWTGMQGLFPTKPGGRNALLFTLLLSSAVVGFSGAAWVLLERRMTWFDQLLPRRQREQAVAHLEDLYRRQSMGVVFAIAGVAVVLLQGGVPPAYLPTNLTAYYAMSLLALTSGAALWTALRVSGLVTIVYRTRSDELRFLPVQFASTPGVVLISEAVVMGAAALLLAIGFSVALWLYVRFSPELLPAYMEGSLITIWVVLGFLFIRVAVRPIFEIHLKLIEVKSRRLEFLNWELASLRPATRLCRARRRARELALLEGIAMVGASSTMPSRALALLPFAAALVGAVVGLGLLWAVGEPPMPRPQPPLP